MAGISLLPEPAEGTITIGEQPRILKDEGVLRSRIIKADYALAEESPGQNAIAADFWIGMEQRVREQAVLSEVTRRRTEWQRVSKDIIRAAAAEGRELTATEKSYVMDRPVEEVISDRTALEERFARRIVDETAGDAPDPVSGASRSVVTKQQIAQRILEDVQQKYDDTSWASWGADLAKQLIPFYTWSNVVDQIEGLPTSSFLAGSNVAEQMRGLYFLPAEEFEEKLAQAVAEIAESNIIDAVQFARAATAYSTSDQIWDDIFTGLDTVDVATLGLSVAATAGAKALKGARSLKRFKDIAEVTANPKMTAVDRKVVAGDLEGAAEHAVHERLAETGLVTPRDVLVDSSKPDEFLNTQAKTGFSLEDPENYLRSAGSLSNEQQRRLIEQLEENRSILKSSLTDITHIVRTDEEAFLKGVANAKKDFLRINYRLEDSIVDVRPVRAQLEEFGQVDRVDFVIGTKDAGAFKSAAQAALTADRLYRLPKGSYEIEQVGDSYFLKMSRNVREDSLDVLDIRLNTDNQAPINWKNRWVGWLRNPDDIRPLEASAVAKQATYGANAVMNRMSEVAKSIGKLGKNESERLSTIIDEARFKKRKVVDPQTGQTVTVSGRFYKDVGELERAYLKRGYSLPTDKEIEGYFAFRQLMDYDHAVRNISVYRDKARLGIDQKSIGWIFTDEAGKKIYKQTDFFEGRLIDALPSRSGEPYTLAWYNGKTGKTNFLTSDSIGAYGKWGEIDELIAQDYKIIQVADPKSPTLKDVLGTKGEPIQYLLVRDVKEKPLSSNQVPYNEGGHWIYPSGGFYLKQPQTHKTGLGRRIYDGDVTAHWFGNTQDSRAFLDAYELGRQNLDNPNLDAIIQGKLPYTADEFRKLFRTPENPDGPFSPDTPFTITESGQRAADTLKLQDIFREPIVDAASSEHSLLGKLNTQYAQERGERLTSIKNTGTEANPIYKLTGAPLMDSMQALGRSTAQLAKSRFFDDLKHKVVENWATQFAEVIDAPSEAVRADPMRYMREPIWKKGADKATLAAAKQNRRAMIYLLGEDTLDMGAIKWARQKVVDGIAKAHGRDSKLLDSWKWDTKADPSTILRSAVFDLKLGLFNVVQFPLQGQAVLHAAAIDGNPLRAVQANFLYWSMRMRGLASTNKGAQSMFGKAVSKALGVDQKIVDEMYDAFHKSGMSQMEGEYARLDDYLNPTQLWGASGVSKGLDAGRVFFKEGNMWHRGTAFATSFLRWRQENPTKMLNAEEMRKIVDRADLYYINMSRASNNDILASSVPSVPAQFFTFHKNLSEQLMGARLTPAEKARVLLMYSTVYGLPVGVGVGIPGAAVLWPVSESVRQYTLENGIETDANAVTQFLMNGAGSMAIQMLTGEGYNFGDRYGPGGLSWLRDLTDGNLFEVAAGASGSSLADAIGRIDPFYRAITSVFTPGDDYYPLSKEDFIDAAREISTVNNIAKVYYAVTTGQYLTKSDMPVMNIDTDPADVVALALGLTPQDVSDTYLKIRSMDQERQAKAALSKEVLKHFSRGMKASADGDEKKAEAFYRKAHHMIIGANLDPKERADLWRRAVTENRTLFDKIDRNFMLRDPEQRMRNYLNKED